MKSSRCRGLLLEVLKRAYSLNVKHPGCGFVVPVNWPREKINVDSVKIKFDTIEDCIALVWPHFMSKYIGNYKRIVYVLGISVEDFRRRVLTLKH